MYLRCCERRRGAHGVVHLGYLNIQSFKLALKFFHETWNLKRKRDWDIVLLLRGVYCYDNSIVFAKK